jgi:hypothetical protein
MSRAFSPIKVKTKLRGKLVGLSLSALPGVEWYAGPIHSGLWF